MSRLVARRSSCASRAWLTASATMCAMCSSTSEYAISRPRRAPRTTPAPRSTRRCWETSGCGDAELLDQLVHAALAGAQLGDDRDPDRRGRARAAVRRRASYASYPVASVIRQPTDASTRRRVISGRSTTSGGSASAAGGRHRRPAAQQPPGAPRRRRPPTKPAMASDHDRGAGRGVGLAGQPRRRTPAAEQPDAPSRAPSWRGSPG